MPILNNPFGALGTYHIPVNSSGSGGTLSATISGTSFSPVSPEYAIQGKMVTVDIVYTGADMERLGLTSVPNYFEDTIKKDLILKLAHSMARDNYIEFTKQMDSLEDVIRYRARIYATPDDKVRYLRIKGVI